MSELVQGLENMSLDRDITKTFFASAAEILPGKVVTAAEFSLFQGTQALEVNNPRLDTTLLLSGSIDSAAISFDLARQCSLEEVLAVMDRLFAGLGDWFDSSSLALTALACQYCEKMLENYNAPLSRKILSDCHFFEEKQADSEDFMTGVLRTFLIGYLRFIGYVLLMAKSGVIYDEEDIVSNNFGLSFLQELPLAVVVEKLESTRKVIRKGPKFALLERYFGIILGLLRIETILSIDIVTDGKARHFNISFIDDTLAELSNLKQTPLESLRTSLPSGSFSTLFQTRVDNNLPPKPLPVQSPSQMYVSTLTALFGDLKYITRLLKPAEGGKVLKNEQIHEFMMWFGNRRFNHVSVVVRMMVQLWLIRDNKSILGSSVQLMDMMVTDMNRVSMLNTHTAQLLEIGLGEETPLGVRNWAEIKTRIPPLLLSLEGGYYEILSLYSQNPSRQRQHVNRLLVLFDTLQVEAENFEVLVFDSLPQGSGDVFEYGGQLVPQVPLSSYVYSKKLGLMVEMLFRGVELNLYKPFELLSVYWYVSYLLETMLTHINGRLVRINEQSIAQVDVAKMAKKLKKLSGDKKVRYKAQIDQATAVLPELKRIQQRLQYEARYYQLLLRLATAYRTYLAMVNSLLPEPPFNRISVDLMYQFRFKPFSSIGVPEQPSYKQFNDSVAQIIPADKVQRAKLCVLSQSIVDDVIAEFSEMGDVDVLGWGLTEDDAQQWYAKLRSSAENLKTSMIELNGLEGALSGCKFSVHGHIDDKQEGCHPWFPRYRIRH
ncbi:hypothetical protein BABINDRAFT_160442 [Babjeviella inositovora NRRL Y-12698]|uniref:Uncharacterized protein n=1 Tax=Babjeviella inositovora NRRL Y-12698 TaxID=984486 RepID=A0A1E3QTK7_9ASCO|nr:uncharacterized protein BABINDRAFT_160442 [Babjeviella inositovora NRRL Y-12698]ODQ81023.1 hypothetical protein BABINDRAFT_160442 [Babjeviella inositovora NRRL Y-12698]